MDNVNFDVRTYPIDEPQGNTRAFASVGISVDDEDLVAIRGIRVIDGERGLFVSMPQTQDKEGKFHDTAFPLTGDLRREMNRAVLDAYAAALEDRIPSIEDRLTDGSERAAEYSNVTREPAAKSAPIIGE
ncbi:MAG: SpoVG family protein [Oscillospiraceae bacterium]|jgi:stage V sporulation protein G|nr:SpoVG family protein [Oscillospiraceae bacterium]